MALARRMSRLGTETAFELLAKAKSLESQGKDIIHLEIGEPDFDTPVHIKDAAKQALDDGYTHYVPTLGLPELREAIAENVSATRGTTVQSDQVVVTPGAKPIMFFTILALVQQGDEVIHPNPGFPIYESMIRFCGAKPVPMRLIEEKAYHPDLDDLASKISNRTRLVILNSPQNPTGSVMSEEEINTLADILKGREDVYVLSDEIYKDIIYDGKHFSISSLPWMTDRTIILDGLSKSYAMTGWRLGYGIFPQDMVESISRLAVNSVSCATALVQRAAIQALKGPQDSLKVMSEEFRKRRDAIVQGFKCIPGTNCPKPEGAFYAFPSIRGTGLSSNEFEELSLYDAGVALLSGTAFGKYGDGYIRLSYANSLENINEALNRLETLVRKTRSAK